MKFFKNNKKLFSVLFAIGLTSVGVPAYLAQPVSNAVVDQVQVAE